MSDLRASQKLRIRYWKLFTLQLVAVGEKSVHELGMRSKSYLEPLPTSLHRLENQAVLM